jgi:hypothetical protein
MKQDEMYTRKIAARQVEKARIKQLKELQKNINIISDEMFNQSLISRSNQRQQILFD